MCINFWRVRKCFWNRAKTHVFPILKQNIEQFSQNETVLVTLAVSRAPNTDNK
jgi:hypothetical protein